MKSHCGAILVALVMSACGRQADQVDPNSGATSKDEVANVLKNEKFPAEIAKSLPEATIIRVPVDSNGLERQSDAELRLVLTAPAAVDVKNVDAVFANNLPPKEQSADDLDSSNESWNYGGGYGRGYGSGGYNRGYGYGGYNRGYGYGGYNSYYYNSFRPTYGYYGSYYSYYAPSYYNYGGYNYYYYPRNYYGY